MRRIATLIFLMVVMVVNAAVLPVWAKSCPHNMQAEPTMQNMVMDDMPCHTQKQQSKHCEGLCLCAYLAPAMVQPKITAHFVSLPILSQTFSVFNERLTSVSQAPLQRPPKISS